MLSKLRTSLSKLNSLKIKPLSSSASSSSSTAITESYPGGMQFFHWVTGGSIAGCIACVQGAIYTKDKQLKGDLMFYHKSFGLLAFGLLFPRLAVRLTSKIPEHLPGATWEIFASKISHFLLYGFMIVMPVSGVIMGYYSGKGLPFFWQTIPGAPKADGATAKQAFQIHKFIGSYFQYLIPLHVGAVGYHFVVKGRNIIPRMLSFR